MAKGYTRKAAQCNPQYWDEGSPPSSPTQTSPASATSDSQPWRRSSRLASPIQTTQSSATSDTMRRSVRFAHITDHTSPATVTSAPTPLSRTVRPTDVIGRAAPPSVLSPLNPIARVLSQARLIGTGASPPVQLRPLPQSRTAPQPGAIRQFSSRIAQPVVTGSIEESEEAVGEPQDGQIPLQYVGTATVRRLPNGAYAMQGLPTLAQNSKLDTKSNGSNSNAQHQMGGLNAGSYYVFVPTSTAPIPNNSESKRKIGAKNQGNKYCAGVDSDDLEEVRPKRAKMEPKREQKVTTIEPEGQGSAPKIVETPTNRLDSYLEDMVEAYMPMDSSELAEIFPDMDPDLIVQRYNFIQRRHQFVQARLNVPGISDMEARNDEACRLFLDEEVNKLTREQKVDIIRRASRDDDALLELERAGIQPDVAIHFCEINKDSARFIDRSVNNDAAEIEILDVIGGHGNLLHHPIHWDAETVTYFLANFFVGRQKKRLAEKLKQENFDGPKLNDYCDPETKDRILTVNDYDLFEYATLRMQLNLLKDEITKHNLAL